MKYLASFLGVLGLATVVLAAWSQPPQPTGRIDSGAPHAEADVEAIQDYFQRYAAAAKAGDLDTYRTFWTDDVVWLPPHEPVVEGIEACMDHHRPYFKNYDQDETLTVEEIKFGGEFTFVRVNYTYQAVPKDGGETVTEDGKGVFLMERKPDGAWVSSHCAWNSNVPLPE
jgi:uncharacterized protein (TIGR02246 family)